MSFTPGPWHVQRRFSNECEIVPRIICAADADRACGWIANLIGAPYLGHESTLPNARLIAAAPDLLEALQAARAMLLLMGVALNEHEEGRKIDAAIARATGA